MTATEILQVIRKDIAATAARGQAAVTLVDLDRYLAGLESAVSTTSPSADPAKQEELRAQALLALHRTMAEQGLEMFRTVIASGQNALKSSFLINGGAAVALLAFIGHLVATPPATHLVPDFAWPLAFFVIGVGVTAIATGFTYLTQALFHRQWLRVGNLLNVVTILLVVASYFTFAAGCYSAYHLFKSLAAERASG